MHLFLAPEHVMFGNGASLLTSGVMFSPVVKVVPPIIYRLGLQLDINSKQAVSAAATYGSTFRATPQVNDVVKKAKEAAMLSRNDYTVFEELK